MGMAINDALHLQSLLQEMKISQLAKPVDLTVFTDSSSDQALASKLGLTRKSKHVQLRYIFIQDLLASGQLQPSKIPAGKNHAAMLAKHLPASTLHKLLPKLGVRTRAADSKDLLSVFGLEVLASREKPRSFFIGMMAEQLTSAQLVAPSVASRACQDSSVQEPRQEAASRDCQDSSLQKHSQEALQSLKASQRTSSRSSFAALLCSISFVSFKIYSLLLYGMLSFVQLCFDTVIVFKQCASRITCLPRASRTAFRRRALRTTTSSSASKSLSATSLQRTKPTTWWMPSLLAILLFSFLGDTASNLSVEGLYVINALSSRSSFSMSFPTYSIRDHLAEGSMASFQQGELIKVLLAHEASNVSASMLEQQSAGKLETEELEEQITEELTEQLSERKFAVKELDEKTTELTALEEKELEEQTKELTKQVKELEEQNTDHTEKVQELEEKNKELEEQQVGLDSVLVKAVLTHLQEQEAKKSFKKIASTQLPQQEVMGAWFEQLDSEQQLIFSSLSISFGNFMVKYAAFKKKEELYQCTFLESSFSENILPTGLANSAQWPSLYSRSFASMKEPQLQQQASACGGQEPRASTGACKRTCRHDSSLLYNQKKKQEKQLDKELLQREFWSFTFAKNFGKNDLQLLQRAEGRSHDSFRHLDLQEQLPTSSFTESRLRPAACQQSSLTAIAYSSFLPRSSFEQLGYQTHRFSSLMNGYQPWKPDQLPAW